MPIIIITICAACVYELQYFAKDGTKNTLNANKWDGTFWKRHKTQMNTQTETETQTQKMFMIKGKFWEEEEKKTKWRDKK